MCSQPKGASKVKNAEHFPGCFGHLLSYVPLQQSLYLLFLLVFFAATPSAFFNRGLCFHCMCSVFQVGMGYRSKTRTWILIPVTTFHCHGCEAWISAVSSASFRYVLSRFIPSPSWAQPYSHCVVILGRMGLDS